MNIIDHSSDDIRQIVPADMSFLSDADQQASQALQSALCALLGGSGAETLVVSGCEVTTTDPRWDGVATGDGQRHTYRYEMAPGQLLHGGRLYDFDGGSWTEETVPAAGADGVLQLERSYQCGLMVFGDETSAPSPVYGEAQYLSERPHRRLVARVEQAEATERLSPTAAGGYRTSYGTTSTDHVRCLELRWLPQTGELRRRINL